MDFDKDKLLYKKIPLNFNLKTWTFIQYFATFTYIIYVLISSNLSCGFFRNFPIPFTIGIVISSIALFCSQLYTYGGYISNTVKDIAYPAIVSVVCLISDILFYFVGKNVQLNLNITNIFIIYFLSFAQYLLLYITYRKIEYKEVNLEDLLSSKTIQEERMSNVLEENKRFFI